MTATGLEPRWASAPGATISAALSERGESLAGFARNIGLPYGEAEQLLSGEHPITLELARRLADVIGGSTSFWLTREAQYVEDRDRVDADRWSQELPISQMASFGWVEKPKTWQERIAVSLEFFDVADVKMWESRYDHAVAATHFRTSPSFDLESPATTVWFRAADREVEARAPIREFRREAFADVLSAARRLTRLRDPERFVPELVEMSARCGVHIVVVRAPSGCPASGASRMYNGNPLIQLSARYLSDDHFWFSFFHEAGHVMLHQLEQGFIDIPETEEDDHFELEANDFATAYLLGPQGQRLRETKRRWSHRDAIHEARGLDLAPGLLVGQLQYAGAIPKNHLNKLKRRYVWRGSRLIDASRKGNSDSFIP